MRRDHARQRVCEEHSRGVSGFVVHEPTAEQDLRTVLEVEQPRVKTSLFEYGAQTDVLGRGVAQGGEAGEEDVGGGLQAGGGLGEDVGGGEEGECGEEEGEGG